jgi:hypothetical protein
VGRAGRGARVREVHQALAQSQNFKIVAAIDDEQSGWNEGSDNVFDVFSCGGATDSTAMGDMLVETAACIPA